MKKYFGTDGIRGRYGEGINEEVAFLLGAALGKHFSGVCVVGRDTRVSGSSLLRAFSEGLSFSNSVMLDIGVIPTPAVSLMVKEWGAGCGVMITASHNSPEYNGLKVFGKEGLKLSQEEESEIEQMMERFREGKLLSAYCPLHTRSKGESFRFDVAKKARRIYIKELSGLLNGERLDGLKILLDAGNGAAGTIAREVFKRLGAKVFSINDAGDGAGINVDCGSENIHGLVCKMEGFDLGFGFDGDADRVAVVYDNRVMDGNSVLWSLARGRGLKDGAVVGTVMSNSVLERKLTEDGRRFIRTAVGDRYILEEMIKNGYSLGGEESGHYIFYPERKTGDGILTALKVCLVFLRGELEFLELLPQKTVSLESGGGVLEDERMQELTERVKKSGRVQSLLVRMSGTEPKIRISVEAEERSEVDEVIGEFAALVEIINAGHSK